MTLITYFCLVIMDSDGMNCQNANFLIGTDTTVTRAWTIKVTQYTCGQQDEAGPPGCLQYYTQTSNYIQKYVITLCAWIFEVLEKKSYVYTFCTNMMVVKIERSKITVCK